jgi:hypothetical protein
MEKMDISPPKETYFLSVLQNCNMDERYKTWKGPLLKNKNIGCGINALTFLDVFTRDEGEQLVKIINKRGTSFEEMMNMVFNKNKTTPQTLIEYSIDTLDNVKDFFENLKNMLPNNSCTIAKLMRYPDNGTPVKCNGGSLTSGHSIVFSKNNNKLYYIDPQQEKLKESEDYNLTFKVWSKQCYKYVYLMFNKKQLYITPNYGSITNAKTSLNKLQIHEQSPMDVVVSSTKSSGQSPMDVVVSSTIKKRITKKKISQKKKRYKKIHI